MIDIGDTVERGGRSGRVTGFAPNGWARVKLDNGQQRIWPLEKLSKPEPAVPYWKIEIVDHALQRGGVKLTDVACDTCCVPTGFICMDLPWGRYHANRAKSAWDLI